MIPRRLPGRAMTSGTHWLMSGGPGSAMRIPSQRKQAPAAHEATRLARQLGRF